MLVISLAVVKIRQIFGLDIYIKDSELILWLLASSITSSYIWSRSGKGKEAICSCFIVSVCIFFAIARMTVFYTIDEVRAFREQMNLSTDVLRHWEINNAHTNYLIMGTIWSLMPDFIVENLNIVEGQFAKILHWSAGFVITQIIIRVVDEKLTEKSKIHREIKLMLIYAMIFTLPVYKLAMKSYNYDLFSMLFGILSILLVLVMLERDNYGYGIMAIISGALAVQEKVIAAPVVFIAEVLFSVYILGSKNSNNLIDSIVRRLKISCMAIGIEIGVYFFTRWWVLDILRAGRSIAFSWERTTRQIVYASETLVRKIGLFEGVHPQLLQVIEILFQIVLLTIMVFVIQYTIKILDVSFINMVGSKISGALLLILTLVGIVLNFVPENTIRLDNRLLLWFLQYDRIIIGAITTIGLFMVFYLSFKLLFGGIRLNLTILGILYIMFGNFFLYALTGLDTKANNSRMLNLFILGMQILLLIVILNNDIRLIPYKIMKLWSVGMASAVFLVAETLWGGPFADTIFYPFWNVSIYKKEVEGGWGSIISAAGYKIIDYCKENGILLNDAIIYSLYHGRWPDNTYDLPINSVVINGEGNLQYITDYYEVPEHPPYFADNEFLIYDNYGINRGLYVELTELPDDRKIKPIFYISYRGAVAARVYQGSQLKVISLDLDY